MPNTKDYFFRVWTGVHEAVFVASGGRFMKTAAGMPVVRLTTTGRKSGKTRTTMLTSPVQDGESVVLVASYGGDPRHPAWYLNVQAHPDVEIVMNGRTRKMRARTANAAEKAALWPRITAKYRGYGSYQKRTDRDIPVVILDPAS